jgi:hypothetical protein
MESHCRCNMYKIPRPYCHVPDYKIIFGGAGYRQQMVWKCLMVNSRSMIGQGRLRSYFDPTIPVSTFISAAGAEMYPGDGNKPPGAVGGR